MGRRRLFQGRLELNPNGSQAFDVEAGTKIFMSNVHGVIDVEFQNEHFRVSTGLDIRREGSFTIKFTNNSNEVVNCYLHLEDHRADCVINTVVCKKCGQDRDSEPLVLLRKWRDNVMTKSSYGELLLSQYYDLAEFLSPKLDRINDPAFFNRLRAEFISPMVEAAKSRRDKKVIDLQRSLMLAIENKLNIFSRGGFRQSTSISVTFKNSTLFREQWTIKDGTNDTQLFSGYLEARDSPGDSVQLTIQSPDDHWGEARYLHSGQSIWTHVDWLENGDVVEMH